ncbi:MAG: uracil-DNA glycosylase family protein [Rubrivivax sp.]
MNLTAAPEILDSLLRAVRGCQACASHLPLGPRPMLQASATARIVIVGQAPGARVHASGIPWSDASGERLRRWMDIDAGVFYDEHQVTIRAGCRTHRLRPCRRARWLPSPHPGRVALMCAEAVPWRCHRSLIADALIAHGVSACEIVSPTKLRAHKLTPFARVLTRANSTWIDYPPEPP